jgi:hypothetical protein
MKQAIEIRVARRRESVTERKHRDYPWGDLSEFLASKAHAGVAFCDWKVADEIEERLQTEIMDFMAGRPAPHIDLCPAPMEGFHNTVVSRETFIDELQKSVDRYCVHNYFPDYPFDAASVKRHNCLSLSLDVSDIVTGAAIYLMLRPFIFPGQGDHNNTKKNGRGLYHAGSLRLVNCNNPNGWFHQLKWRFE